MKRAVDPEKSGLLLASLIARIQRRVGRLRLSGLFAAVVMATGHRLLADPADPAPLRGLEEVSQAQVELRGGFWGPRLKTQHEVTVPLNKFKPDGKTLGTRDDVWAPQPGPADSVHHRPL